MANVFSKSLDDLGKWLQTAEGRRLGASAIGAPGTPLASPDIVRPPASQNPPTQQGRLFGYPAITSEGTPYTPGGQSGMAVSPSPVWNPNAPSPVPPATRTGASGGWDYTSPAPQAPASDYDRMYRMPSQTGTGAAPTPQLPTDRVPAAVPWNEQPTGQVTGAPTGPFEGPPTSMTPTGQVTGAPTGPFQAPTGPAPTGPAPATGQPVVMPTESGNVAMPPTKVTQKVESPTHSTTITHQAKQPGGGDGGGGGGAANRAGAGAAAAGNAPAGGNAPVGGGAQTTNVQVPAHPGLLERIGQTIGHFFSGTLGQTGSGGASGGGYNMPGGGGYIGGSPAPGQSGYWYPNQATATAAGDVGNVANSAVSSGISRALASGRQRIATHGGRAPASAAPPAPPAPAPQSSWAYNADWTRTPLGSPDITNPVASPSPSWAYGPYGVTPLGSPDIVRPIPR